MMIFLAVFGDIYSSLFFEENFEFFVLEKPSIRNRPEPRRTLEMLVFPCVFLVIIVKQLFHLFQLQHLTFLDLRTMFTLTTALLAKTGKFELLGIVFALCTTTSTIVNGL